MDAAYKNESPNGRPLVSKPYTKQVEDLPVLIAREAEVESTRQLTEADLPVAMQQAPGATHAVRISRFSRLLNSRIGANAKWHVLEPVTI